MLDRSERYDRGSRAVLIHRKRGGTARQIGPSASGGPSAARIFFAIA
jgi:hypothetical protein